MENEQSKGMCAFLFLVPKGELRGSSWRYRSQCRQINRLKMMDIKDKYVSQPWPVMFIEYTT